MKDTAVILLTLGALFALGLAGDVLAKRVRLPRVSLLLLIGIGIGPSGLDVLPDFRDAWFPVVTDVALVMVGFLLGHGMSAAGLRERGRPVLRISLAVVLATAGIVLAGLLMLGVDPVLAMLLAGLATATDPAATVDVIRETRASGPFSETLEGIVAIDDAWGLVVFSLLLAAAQGWAGTGDAGPLILQGLWEVVGAMLVGVLLGAPVAYLSGRIQPGEPTQAEALGAVLMCGGMALWLEVSFILAAMVMGAVVVNRAAHHRRPFAAIEGIEWPFMVLFFLLAGASMRVESLLAAGVAGAGYVGLRVAGRIAGGWLGGRWAGADPLTTRWMGAALVPQAGIALGMALYAGQHFPELRDQMLNIVVGSTVLFEVVGPVLTRRALRAAGGRPARA